MHVFKRIWYKVNKRIRYELRSLGERRQKNRTLPVSSALFRWLNRFLTRGVLGFLLWFGEGHIDQHAQHDQT